LSPYHHELESVNYLARLTDSGQAPLIAWAAHCIDGTLGATMPPALAEAIALWSAAHGRRPTIWRKGVDQFSEQFGGFKLCVPRRGKPWVNVPLLEKIAAARQVDVLGEAWDFCLITTLLQIVEYFRKTKREEVLRKIRILRDCTSCVFKANEAKTDSTALELANRYGFGITTTVQVVGLA